MIYSARKVQPIPTRDGSEALPFRVRFATLMRELARRASTRIPELVLMLFAIALRISLTRTYDVTLGYDFPAHIQYVRYLAEHRSLPPYTLNFSTYNPALWYALAAVMLKFGVTLQAIGRVSIACSCLQLVVVWIGLEVYLRESRLARILALALAAVVPASVHVAGFFSNHTLNDVFCTGAIVLLPQVILRRGRAALWYGAAAGACLGLALLTKISGMTVLEAFLAAAAIMIARSRRAWLATTRGLFPGAAMVLVVLAAISGWHYVRHKILYGKFVLIAYDAFYDVDPIFKIPYLDRRTFGFLGYWNTSIYEMPFWASATRPYARFWPILVATTFSDYYNFAFVPRPKANAPAVRINGKPMLTSAILPARGSVIGGTAVALDRKSTRLNSSH